MSIDTNAKPVAAPVMLPGIVADALSFCDQAGFDRFTLIVPFALGADELAVLLGDPRLMALLVRSVPDQLCRVHQGRLFSFNPQTSINVTRGFVGTVIIVGGTAVITRQMLLAALWSGRGRFCCCVDGTFQYVSAVRFGARWAGERLIRLAVNRPQNDPILRLAQWGYSQPKVRAAFRRVFQRDGLTRRGREIILSPANAATAPVPRPATSQSESLAKMLTRAAAAAPVGTFVPGRVVLLNAGLAAGGAERQIVNTLVGLQAESLESASFLGEYVFAAPDLTFYLPLLQQAKIDVQQVPRAVELASGGIDRVAPILAEFTGELPTHLIEEILNLIVELRKRRPEVLHVWQDSTSIKGAIAGLIAGVPKIILSSRNVNPSNFAYSQPYMRPAYQALAGLPQITFVNNSEAGAKDYCRWLDLPRSRFRVVRNGVNFAHLARRPLAETVAFRERSGLPAKAPLVGGVFRFAPEKQPFLWLDCAVQLAELLPEHHFVIAGEGPLRSEMLRYVPSTRVARRIHLLPPQPDVATLLSCLDLFVLTSRFEGTPNVVLEAQWLGVPVVVTPAGGTKEAVLDGTTGRVAHSGHAGEIVSHAERILRDPEFRARAMVEGPRFVSDRFGFERMIAETMELYGFAASRRRCTTKR